MKTSILYQIFPNKPEAHLFEVHCTISNPTPEGQTFSLPVWIPGSYMVREFAKNIVQIHAWCNEQPVDIEKLDKSSWRCAPCQGPLTIKYEVYCWDLSVRAAHLDQTHGYFNGTSVFVKAHGHEYEPCEVEILPPTGKAYAKWRVATSMPRLDAELYGFGKYQAQDYDELIDHPVEMGEFMLGSFDVHGVPHDVVLTGRFRVDMPRLCADLREICETQVEFFGELPEMERYVFMTMVIGDGYGGLEHRSSCSLMCSRDSLPLPGRREISEDYREYLSLCSHEYFHTWNVKRIKPAVFLPYDLTQEAYTRQLWAFEGITSYYEDLFLVRSKRIHPQDFLDMFAEKITRVHQGNGRFKQSVAESSMDTWIKLYRQDENSPNAIVNYYAKGALIALALDLTIRRETNGATSLDDVMRELWREYGKPLVGVPEGGVEKLAASLSDVNLDTFFQEYLYGTKDLPLAELFQAVGVSCVFQAPKMKKGAAGGKKVDPVEAARRGSLGVRTTRADGGMKLVYVYDDGAAQQAGLSANDVVIAIDEIRVDVDNFSKQLASYLPGETVTIHAFRRDELMIFRAVLKAPAMNVCKLTLEQDLEPCIDARQQTWLGIR